MRAFSWMTGWLVWLAAGSALATPQPVDAPVTFTAKPGLVVPGGTVTLGGSTPLVTKQASEVTLTIAPPAADGGDGDGTPQTLTAPVDANGGYSLPFTATERMGEYRVTVTAPDGKGSTTGRFAVLLLNEEKAAEQVTGVLWQAYQPLFEGVEMALDEVEAILESLPASAEKAEARKRVSTLRLDYPGIRKGTAEGANQTGPYVEGAIKGGAGAALKAPLTELLDTAREMKTETTAQRERIRQRVAESRAATDQCVKLDHAIELLNLASMLMNVWDTPKKILINLLTDKGIPAAIDAAKIPNPDGADTKKFVVTQGQKALAAFGLGGAAGLSTMVNVSVKPGAATFFVGAVGDITNFALKLLYEKNCSRFEGPFTASIRSVFKHNGVMYWTYTMHLKGKLILTAPKGATVTAMKGRFEGVVDRYDVQENTVDAFATALKPYLVFRKLMLPTLAANAVTADEFGSYFNQLVPQSFYVPVDAVRKEGEVVLNVREGGQVGLTQRYNQVKLYLVFMSMMIPQLMEQSVPMESAEFVLSRGMRKDATFEIKNSGGTQTIARSFTRNVPLQGGDVVVDFAVDVKACSPKCVKGAIENTADRIKGALGGLVGGKP